MTTLPRKKFLQSPDAAGGPGVLTTLLRTYVEERDRESLDLFFNLLYDEHFTDIAIQVHSYGPASEITVKEVIDDSLAKLLEDVVQQKYRKAPESAAEHLKYLLRRRFIDRRRSPHRNHEDVSDHRETIIDPSVPSPEKAILSRESEAMADLRLERALTLLSPRDQEILRLKFQGATYPEMSQKLGMVESTLWKAVERAVDRLLAALAQEAPTMAHRLKDLREKAAPAPRSLPWPSREVIRQALPGVTERVRSVLERLHFGGVPEEDLAREFGEETLALILRRGYDLLEARFKVSFPEAFERADP